MRRRMPTKRKIDEKIAGYADPVQFYVDRLAEGIATITAAFAPNPVIVRLSDFKSNEYANLIGGKRYELHEENPMIDSAASRYVDPSFKAAFALECRGEEGARGDGTHCGMRVMIPFVRTLDEGRKVIEVLAENGLKQGQDDLTFIMMCELSSNACCSPTSSSISSTASRSVPTISPPAHAGPRPRFEHRCASVRRTRRRSEEVEHGDQDSEGQGQIRRHLWPGSVGSSGSRAVAARRRYRIGVAHPDTVVDTMASAREDEGDGRSHMISMRAFRASAADLDVASVSLRR